MDSASGNKGPNNTEESHGKIYKERRPKFHFGECENIGLKVSRLCKGHFTFEQLFFLMPTLLYLQKSEHLDILHQHEIYFAILHSKKFRFNPSYAKKKEKKKFRKKIQVSLLDDFL